MNNEPNQTTYESSNQQVPQEAPQQATPQADHPPVKVAYYPSPAPIASQKQQIPGYIPAPASYAYQAPQQNSPKKDEASTSNILGILSLIAGILGLTLAVACCCLLPIPYAPVVVTGFTLVLNIVGIILGTLAKDSSGKRTGCGTAGLICNILCLIIAIILIITLIIGGAALIASLVKYGNEYNTSNPF